MSLDDIRMRIVLGVAGLDQTGQLTTTFDKLRTTAEKTASGIEQSGKSASAAGGFFERLAGKLRETEASYQAVFRAGFQLQLVGDQIADVGRKGLDVLGGTVDAYKDYDLILRKAGVALNTNTEWQGKLNNAVQDTATSIGLFDPTEVADAYYLWGAQTGVVVDNSEALARVQQTVNDVLIATATAGGDLTQNMRGVYGVLQQYGLGADAASDVTKDLMVLTERTAADFGDLTGAFTYTGSAMGNLGVKFEDTAQVMGILADASFRGSKAGRGLSMVFEGLVSPTEKGKDALNDLAKAASGGKKSWEDLVFPIKDGKRQFVGMREMIGDMATALQKLSPYERQQAINAIFTNNATRALLPVIKDQIALWDKQGASGQKLTSILDEQKYSLATSGDYFENAKTQMLGSIDAVVGSFKNSFFPIIQRVAEAVMKNVRPALDFLKGAFDSIKKVMDDNPGLVDFAVKLLAIASAVLLVGGTVLGAVGSFLLLFAGIGMVTTILPALLGAAAPVIAVIAGIAAGIAILYTAWTNDWLGIREVAASAIDAVTGVLSTLAHWVDIISGYLAYFATTGKKASDWLSGLPAPIAAVVEWFTQLYAAVSVALGNIIPSVIWFATVVQDFFTRYIVPNVQKVIDAFGTFWSWLQPILIALGQVFIDVIVNKVVPSIVDFVNHIIDMAAQVLAVVGPFVTAVVDLFTTIVNFVFNDLAPVWDWLLQNVFIPFFGFLADLFATRLQGIMDIVSGVFTVITGIIQVVLGTITGIIQGFLALIHGDWKGFGDAMDKATHTIFEGIKNIISGIFNAIKGFIEVVISNIGNIFTGGLGKFLNIFKDGFGAIFKFMAGIPGGMAEVGSSLIKALWTGANNFIPWILDLVRGFGGHLLEAAGSFLGSIPSIGKNIVTGLWNGIVGMKDWIVNKLTSWVKDVIPGPLKDILGIHSPSRVTAEIGRFVALGLAAGIATTTAPVLDSVDKLTGAVVTRAELGARDVNAALSSAGLSANTSFSVNSANEKSFTIRLEVVSPDGSVDKLTQDNIRAILQPDLIAAIEHAASLD